MKSRTRLINCIVDLFVISILLIPLEIFVTKVHGKEFLSQELDTFLRLLIFLFYYFFMELIFGRTIGKFITKTKVLTLDDQEPKPETILLRTLCRLIPFFDAVSFLNTKKTGLHDSLSKTKLIEI